MHTKINNDVYWIDIEPDRAHAALEGEVQYDKKIIYLAPHLRGQKLVEVVAHEVLHVFFPEWGHRQIGRVSRSIADVFAIAEHMRDHE